MSRSVLRPVLVLVAAIATIVINFAAVLLPLNGLTTGELADRFHVYFVPAGYVFSIWSVIYLLLIVYAVWQVLPAQRDNARLAAIVPAFTLSCLANMTWIWLWHHEQVVASLAAMGVLLASLIWIYLTLDIGRASADRSMRWFVHALFSVYLGWITVATIANATTVLDFLKWNGWGVSPEMWTAIMLGVAVALAALVAHVRRDALYLLVLVWAFAGIAVKFPDTPIVTAAAWSATALVGILVLFSLWRRHQASLPLLPA
jgi:hypothetical protein